MGKRSLNHSAFTRHLASPIAALVNPLCLLLCLTAAQPTFGDIKTGDIRGTVFTLDSDGVRSVVPGVEIRLEGPPSPTKTITDQQGSFYFSAVPPATYQIDVNAPGLAGSKTVTVLAGATLDIPMELKVEI